MAEEPGTTATIEPATDAITATAPAPDDGGEAVHVEDSPRDANRTEYKDDETPEAKETRMRAAFDKAQEMSNGPAREQDGTFKAQTGKIPLKKDADPGDEDPLQADEPKAKVEETPEQRERIVVAHKALRRAGWDQDEIDALTPDKVLVKGEKLAKDQAKADELIAAGRAKAEAEAQAEDLPATNAEDEQSAEVPTGVLPDDVLDFLPAEEQNKVKASVAKHIEGVTKRAQYEVAKVRSDLFEDRCVGIQQELAANFPSLKGEQSPDSVFVQKFRKLRDSGQYQLDTRAGIKELMQDAATIAFGTAIKQEVQKSMIDRNRAALAGQPDPKTLTVPSKNGTITKDELGQKAFELRGLPRLDAEAQLHKWRAGRQIVG